MDNESYNGLPRNDAMEQAGASGRSGMGLESADALHSGRRGESWVGPK